MLLSHLWLFKRSNFWYFILKTSFFPLFPPSFFLKFYVSMHFNFKNPVISYLNSKIQALAWGGVKTINLKFEHLTFLIEEKQKKDRGKSKKPFNFYLLQFLMSSVGLKNKL